MLLVRERMWLSREATVAWYGAKAARLESEIGVFCECSRQVYCRRWREGGAGGGNPRERGTGSLASDGSLRSPSDIFPPRPLLSSCPRLLVGPSRLAVQIACIGTYSSLDRHTCRAALGGVQPRSWERMVWRWERTVRLYSTPQVGCTGPGRPHIKKQSQPRYTCWRQYST